MNCHTQKSCFWQDVKKKECAAAFVKGNLLVGLLAYLFYHTFSAWLLVLVPGNVLYFYQWRKKILHKKEQEFQMQFKDAMQEISEALSVGYAVENAVSEAYRSLQMLYPADSRICREFARMVHELQMNCPAEQVWNALAERTGQEDVESLSTVLVTAKKNGGDLVRILRQAISQICEKADVRREVEVLCASRRLEFQVLCAVPVGMIGYMKLSFPLFMEVLYGNLFGIVFMSACLGVYAAAYVLGEKLTEVVV